MSRSNSMTRLTCRQTNAKIRTASSVTSQRQFFHNHTPLFPLVTTFTHKGYRLLHPFSQSNRTVVINLTGYINEKSFQQKKKKRKVHNHSMWVQARNLKPQQTVLRLVMLVCRSLLYCSNRLPAFSSSSSI